MTAKGALIAIAVLFAGHVIPVADAAARATEGRLAKPATRTAAPATTARPSPPAQRPADPTLRGSQQRGRRPAAETPSASAGQGAHRPRRGAANATGGISCVPYVRQVTGMDVRGNGRDWWFNAAGRYARGNRPEVGAVMAFAASGGMRAGHVAVVEQVISSREVLIHHANWAGPGIRRGSIMRGVSVIDVSDNNDWSRVRVQVGHHPGTYGRVYAVHGFIYNRPDVGGVQMAGDLRRVNAAEAGRMGLEEVAQAPRRR